jgi:hypothetical protein
VLGACIMFAGNGYLQKLFSPELSARMRDSVRQDGVGQQQLCAVVPAQQRQRQGQNIPNLSNSHNLRNLELDNVEAFHNYVSTPLKLICTFHCFPLDFGFNPLSTTAPCATPGPRSSSGKLWKPCRMDSAIRACPTASPPRTMR